MNTQKRYSPEFRERAVRLVLEHKDKYPSEWAALTSIAEKMGCTAETLRNWLRRAELDLAQRPGASCVESDYVRSLERENRALKRANEILRQHCENLPSCNLLNLIRNQPLKLS